MAPRGFAAAIISLVLGLGIAATGCGQQGPPGASPEQQSSTTPSPTAPSSSAGGGPATAAPTRSRAPGPTAGPGSTAPDGPQDPAQGRVRTGPVASFGGPAYGDQGIEQIGQGTWCDTVAVFWGGDAAVPAGVTFRFDKAVTQPSTGLDVQAGTCGTQGADRPCIGLRFAYDSPGVTCSMVLRPRTGFRDGTTISFVGTLTCPTRAVCDQVAAREVTPGPPIVVRIPAAGPSAETSSTASPSADASPPGSTPTGGGSSTGGSSTGTSSEGGSSTGGSPTDAAPPAGT